MAAALCFGSASAVEVYDLEPDVGFFSLDSGASLLAADDDWYTSVLDYLFYIDLQTYNIDRYTKNLDKYFSGSLASIFYNSELDNGETLNTSTIFGLLDAIYIKLIGAGDTGVLGLLNTLVSDNQTTFTYLSDLNSSVSGWSQEWTSAMTIPAGTTIVNSAGFTAEASSARSLVQLLNLAFRGFSSQLSTAASNLYLDASGSRSTASGNMTFSNLVRRGFLGLSSNISTQTEQLGVDLDEQTQQLSGDLHQISDGEYGVSLYDSNSGSEDSLIGVVPSMGHMLLLYLDALQADLGALTFLYADEEMVQSKKDSASNIEAADQGFLAPDSVGGVSADSLGDAADAVGGTKELFDTGVSVGQAFEQLQGSGPLEFFTSETASNLNTVPATASEDDEDFVHFYDPTNSEFFELIGKGAD